MPLHRNDPLIPKGKMWYKWDKCSLFSQHDNARFNILFCYYCCVYFQAYKHNPGDVKVLGGLSLSGVLLMALHLMFRSVAIVVFISGLYARPWGWEGVTWALILRRSSHGIRSDVSFCCYCCVYFRLICTTLGMRRCYLASRSLDIRRSSWHLLR